MGRRSVLALVLAVAVSVLCCRTHAASYDIGVGKSDVTGPAAEVVMMGYADSSQTTAGILNRLYARAFIVHDTATGERVVYVNCDLHSIMQLVHQEVLQELQTKYDGLYTEQNVVLHATHTHGGPGGASAHVLYAFTGRGVNQQNLQRIIMGIVKAIDVAHASLAPGKISWSKTSLPDGGKQRSVDAYLANPAAERAKYETDHDVDLRALQFRANDGTLRGVLAWYAVHPTSLTRLNRFISGDNKGYAEFLVEEKFPGVVVGIGISNAGDVSPNLVPNQDDDDTFRGEGRTDVESAEIIGARQAATVMKLLTLPAEEITGSVVGKLSYVDFSNATVLGAAVTATNPYADRTCPAILGQNFAAGTEDGRALPWFKEGDLTPNEIARTIGSIVQRTPDWVQECQTHVKVPLLAVGLMWPAGTWVPNILPVQVVKMGQFALGVTNFEVSTMAGRRIRESVRAAMSSVGVIEVEVASMANAYAQYVTTREEYDTQHYEGASTLFGPNQLAVLQQELTRVAKSIVDPTVPLVVGPKPPRYDRAKLRDFTLGVVFDTPGWGKRFGDLREDTKSAYALGETVVAEFYGGHAKNRADEVASFCDVEKQTDGGNWVTYLVDAHWDLRYEWHRVGLSESRCVCKWFVRLSNPSSVPGRYRLRHRGFAKHLMGTMDAYEGVSSVFDVMPRDGDAAASRQETIDCDRGNSESCAVL